MKMVGKFPAKVIVEHQVVIMTHELFRRSGVQEPHLLRACHGGGGSFPKKEFSRILKTHFGNF